MVWPVDSIGHPSRLVELPAGNYRGPGLALPGRVTTPRYRTIDHLGQPAIELVAHGDRLVAVHGVGPRIAWFGAPRGDNLLFWDDAGAHRRGAWQLRGGHRLWTTRPGADEAEDTYATDNAPCRIRRLRDGVAIHAPADAARLEKSLVIRAGARGWTIEHRLRNAGDMLWSGGLWGLTCTRPSRATRYAIPLGGGPPAWDVVTLVIPRRWGGGHTSRLVDPQLTLTEDELRATPRGAEAKRLVRAPRGTLIMRDPERGTFTKTSDFDPHAAYPHASNVAIYLAPGRFMVELETMSPIRTIAPGEILSHVERWARTERGAA